MDCIHALRYAAPWCCVERAVRCSNNLLFLLWRRMDIKDDGKLY